MQTSDSAAAAAAQWRRRQMPRPALWIDHRRPPDGANAYFTSIFYLCVFGGCQTLLLHLPALARHFLSKQELTFILQEYKKKIIQYPL